MTCIGGMDSDRGQPGACRRWWVDGGIVRVADPAAGVGEEVFLLVALVDEADLDGDQVGNPAVVQGNITVTNPGLLPWSADNTDFSLEYYTKNGGLFTVGAFRKSIEDYIGSAVAFAKVPSGEN